jgi:threonine/homoserine/homoserine lactone efflux protein
MSQPSLIEATNQLTPAPSMANRMNSMLVLSSTPMLLLLSNCCGPLCVLLHMCLTAHFLHACRLSSPDCVDLLHILGYHYLKFTSFLTIASIEVMRMQVRALQAHPQYGDQITES